MQSMVYLHRYRSRVIMYNMVYLHRDRSRAILYKMMYLNRDRSRIIMYNRVYLKRNRPRAIMYNKVYLHRNRSRVPPLVIIQDCLPYNYIITNKEGIILEWNHVLMLEINFLSDIEIFWLFTVCPKEIENLNTNNFLKIC